MFLNSRRQLRKVSRAHVLELRLETNKLKLDLFTLLPLAIGDQLINQPPQFNPNLFDIAFTNRTLNVADCYGVGGATAMKQIRVKRNPSATYANVRSQDREQHHRRRNRTERFHPYRRHRKKF